MLFIYLLQQQIYSPVLIKIDIDSISKRLGHNDSKVTREIYLHVTQKLESKRNEQLKELKIL